LPHAPPPPQICTLPLHDALPISQQYHWLLGILGLKGSSVEGKAQLASVASSGGLFSLEAQLMLHLIDIYLLEGRKETQQKFGVLDRKSTRLNSSHVKSSYAVFCL